MRQNRPVARIVTRLRHLGWTYRQNKHIVMLSPDGRLRIVMSNHAYAYARIVRDLARMGISLT